jgi:hypothetical protein
LVIASQLARAPRAIQGKWRSWMEHNGTRPKLFLPGPRLSLIISRQKTPPVLRRSKTRTEQPSAHCHAKVQRQRIIRPSSDYFDETHQFFPGIEVDPFAGFIQISQALVFLALNPDQVLVIWIQPDDGAVLRK